MSLALRRLRSILFGLAVAAAIGGVFGTLAEPIYPPVTSTVLTIAGLGLGITIAWYSWPQPKRRSVYFLFRRTLQ